MTADAGAAVARVVPALVALVVSALLVTAFFTTTLAGAAPATHGPIGQAAGAPAAPGVGAGQPDFGSNVIVFDPTMPTSEIQARVDAIARTQVSNQFGRQRYALLFRPGRYGTPAQPLVFQVGYYTEVAGLGAAPGDVTITGQVDVYNQCLPAARGASNCTALVNFWRSLSNLTIDVAGAMGCRASAEFWAVSQAAPMRRVQITGGKLSLMDYCTAGPQYASGGFIADSVAGAVTNGSQQQFLIRNSSIGRWSNGGVEPGVRRRAGRAERRAFPHRPTRRSRQPVVAGEAVPLPGRRRVSYDVFVPAAQRDSRGTSWQTGPAAGRSIPIGDFFLARPSDPVATINRQLALGQGPHLHPRRVRRSTGP